MIYILAAQLGPHGYEANHTVCRENEFDTFLSSVHTSSIAQQSNLPYVTGHNTT